MLDRREQIEAARCFARALDANDFDAASDLLSESCVYDSPDGRFRGTKAIVESYRTSDASAAKDFDRVAYRSEVSPVGRFRVVHITFIDYLVKGELTHEHRYEQILSFDEESRITRIVHKELPGQREAFDAFLVRSGMRRTTT